MARTVIRSVLLYPSLMKEVELHSYKDLERISELVWRDKDSVEVYHSDNVFINCKSLIGIYSIYFKELLKDSDKVYYIIVDGSSRIEIPFTGIQYFNRFKEELAKNLDSNPIRFLQSKFVVGCIDFSRLNWKTITWEVRDD